MNKFLKSVAIVALLGVSLISVASIATSVTAIISLENAENKVKSVAEVTTVFRDYIIGEITNENMNHLLIVTSLIKPTEKVELTIDSPGGAYYPAVAVISNIESRDIDVSCRVGGEASSAAALILLACDDAVVPDTALIMFHLPYMVVNGSIIRDAEITQENIAFVKALGLHKILTEEQWVAYTTGKDVTITGKDFKTQLKNR